MTKTMTAWLLLSIAFAATSSGQDAVKVDPAHHKVEFEDDQVRVVRMVYEPGYKTPMHNHLPGVTVSLSATSVHTWDASGEESDTETVYGTVGWSDGSTVHANRVTGDVALELVRVEIKKNGTEARPAPSRDAAKVDPDHHVIEFENDQVRVLRTSYPAGYETPLHNHLPGINVLLTDRRFQAWYENGETSSPELVKKGTATELSESSDLHRTQNVGNMTGESIRIELKTTLE
jgi:quercetin dioxygenase-like cupin family protein